MSNSNKTQSTKTWKFNYQLIVFDVNGFITASDNALFDVKILHGKSVFKYFPLLDSLIDIIAELDIDQEPLIFPGVQTTFQPLKGYYDFTFTKQLGNNFQLLTHWNIIDKTDHYHTLRNLQQAKQEKYINGLNNIED